MPPDNAVIFKRKLSDTLIRSLTEPGKHADGEVPGLYLAVRASSKVGKSPSKVWRLKYRLQTASPSALTPTLVSRRRATLPAAHATIITELRRQRTLAMARRVRTIIRAVLGFAEGRGWIERNVALSNIEELKIRHVVTSNPAIERPADLSRFLLRLDDCNDGSVAAAMRLLVMLPVRPGELVQMRWVDVDWVGADWRYVVSKTKHLDKSKHIVPLPEQALVLLRELHRIRVVDEEGKGWVFVSPVYLPKDLTDI